MADNLRHASLSILRFAFPQFFQLLPLFLSRRP
jgi:hypothetical protein